MAHSQVRQNFHKDCEDAINKQVNLELHASYVYLALVGIDFENLKNLGVKSDQVWLCCYWKALNRNK